ncbi:hypothetical protein C6503_18295 [Candidatus Poribacteria bacterium]|nr:MAG: hypothetical protein C6503_18295 [Candidatus Poribacteria bacterium]
MNTYQANRYTQFITPLGGIIALTCFFFPWIDRGAPFLPTIDKGGRFTFSMSGVNFFLTEFLGRNALLIAVVFIASVVIIGLSLYMIIRRTPWKSRVPILISGDIGLAILFAERLHYARMTRVIGYSSTYSIKLGFWGTAAGLAIAVIGILLIKAEEENGHFKGSVEEKQHWFVVHAGGIIAFFCFFMHLHEIGTLGTLRGSPGFQLTRMESVQSVLIIIFIVSIIILVGSFYTLASGNLRRLREAVLVSIGVGLGLILAYCVIFYIEEINLQNILGESGTGKYKGFVKFGLWGTILGFIVAAVGMFLTTRKNRDSQVEVPAESG